MCETVFFSILPVTLVSGRNAIRRVSFNILYKYSPKSTVFGTKMSLHLKYTMRAKEFVQIFLVTLG